MRNCSKAFSLPAHKRKKKIFVPPAVESFSFTTKNSTHKKQLVSNEKQKAERSLQRKGSHHEENKKTYLIVCHDAESNTTIICFSAKLRELIPKL